MRADVCQKLKRERYAEFIYFTKFFLVILFENSRNYCPIKLQIIKDGLALVYIDSNGRTYHYVVIMMFHIIYYYSLLPNDYYVAT